MPRGGKRPGAGRKAGVRDKATLAQKGTLEELARTHTITALNTLVKVAKSSESDAARVTAANSILDRAYGKPSQRLEHTGKNGGPMEHSHLSQDELDARIASVMNNEIRPDKTLN